MLKITYNTGGFAVRLAAGAAASLLSALAGDIGLPLILLCMFILLDYASGLAAAWINGELSSRKSIAGIIKKVSYLAVIAVGVGCDYVIRSGFAAAGGNLPFDGAVATVIIIWLLINEMISILENLAKTGVPIPSFLLAAVKRLKISAEKASADKSGKSDKSDSGGEKESGEKESGEKESGEKEGGEDE